MSKKCHLESMSPTELAANGEEGNYASFLFAAKGKILIKIPQLLNLEDILYQTVSSDALGSLLCHEGTTLWQCEDQRLLTYGRNLESPCSLSDY